MTLAFVIEFKCAICRLWGHSTGEHVDAENLKEDAKRKARNANRK